MNKEYYPDQTRNLHPTLEARVAMTIYGFAYSQQRGGSMDFWDQLTEHDKRVVRMVIETVQAAAKAPQSTRKGETNNEQQAS